jgi:ribosomal protein L11 methyltransferase
MKNSQPDYFTLILTNVSQSDIEIVTALVFDYGAAGTEEMLDFVQKGRNYEPETLTKDITQLKIYFTQKPALELIEKLKAISPQIELTSEQNQNQDWLAEWKKGFEPFLLAKHSGGDIWIVPTWRQAPKEAKKIIRMDPGMAFGTGTHETTRLAAGFIADFSSADLLSKPRQTPPHRSLLDVGTGTGLLALLAEHVGFTKIIANDIDPEARRVARENLEINSHTIALKDDAEVAAHQKDKMSSSKPSICEIVDEDLNQISGQYDWVVANIIDGVLIMLQADLKKRVNKNGYLLLTGILNEREKTFRAEFLFDGFKLIERRELGEWVGFLLQKTIK